MRRLIEFFVDRPLVVNALAVATCVIGLATFLTMDRDLIPTIQVSIIQIRGTLPGASAVDTEQFLTFPIEEAVRDLQGIKKIESKTEAGKFAIDVVFKPDHENLTESLETIRSRVDQLRYRLPQDLRPITIRQLREDSVDFVGIAIKPIDETNPEHRKWVRTFAERLDKIPHVVRVESTLAEQDLYIEFDRQRIDDAGINVNLVKQKVHEFLAYQPVGMVRANFERISVELKKGFDGLEALKKLPITRNRVGQGLNLGDLARIVLKASERHEIRRLDGQPYVLLIPYKDTNSDVIDLEARMKKEVASFNERAPDPIEATILWETAFLIERPLNVIMVNGLVGLLIVGVILFLFLGIRVSSMAVVGLPFIYLGTFIVLDYLDIQLNIISMIGLILVLGILVDDAILVSERFLENTQNGDSPREAAVRAGTQLFRPVSGTIITNIVVFTPILFIKSDVSALFFPVPCVIIATLLLSLIESFFILPNHLQHFIPRDYVFKERRIFLVMRSLYDRLLARVLSLRYIAVLLFIALFSLSIWLLTKMEKEFSISVGIQNVYVHAVVTDAKTLTDTASAAHALEQRVKTELAPDEVLYIITKSGRSRVPGGHKIHGLREIEIEIATNFKHEKPEKLANEVEQRLKEKLINVPGFEGVEVFQQKSKSAKEEDIVTIFVSGGDTLSFEEIQQKIRTRITDVASVERIFMDPNRFQKSWQFEPDPEKLALYNLEQAALTLQLRQHFAPQELLRLRFKGDEITAYTKFAHNEDYAFQELNELTVMTPRGIPVSLELLGSWRERSILRVINHRDLLRKFEIDVSYDKKKVTHDDIKKDLEEKLQPLREAYPQYTISVHPPEEEEEAKQWIYKVAIACVGIIFLTLVFVLGSVSQPFLVMFAIPFGFTGVIFAFFSHNMPIKIMAMIGMIGLTGVVVNDSLVMVDTVNSMWRSGKFASFKEAVLAGATTRFKAVILTSLTTLGGVFPLAYGIGGKAGFTQPMVFALGWGLLFATLLTLILLPCTLTILDDAKRLLSWMWRKARRKDAG